MPLDGARLADVCPAPASQCEAAQKKCDSCPQRERAEESMVKKYLNRRPKAGKGL